MNGDRLAVTPAAVERERDWVRDRTVVVELINETRAALGEAFGTTVDAVTEADYRAEVERVFADGDVAVNAAALVVLLRELDVEGDYPGFVVDEILGRELAATIASTRGRAYSLLAEATFHYADVHAHGDPGEAAGVDDLDAALAAGFQTRLPGWDWTESDSPFAVDADE
ncbi:hypothetical protein BRC93_00015 [Halobacteriales archaeon QS_5_70_15]|jgi:hypothetical protein|nr:MAG: hypothetical protein BRC93_00015 [Halobacteriales archaeon QS_5_70_15]